MTTGGRIALVALAAGALAACATSPTGRKQLMLVSEQQAISSSRQAYAQEMGKYQKEDKLVTDPRVLERVRVITGRLVAQAVQMRPDSSKWQWSVQVIDDPKTVNAWCMAGGRMAIYTGLLQQVDPTDDELAQVRARRVGFIFQSFHLVPRLTAFENVELPMVLASLPPAERRRRAEAVLASLTLMDRAHHRPDQLSGGQRQRVAIARAMVMEPTVLLADEPTGNLDTATGEEILALFDELHGAGNTVVVVTHEADVAARAQRMLRMLDGRIVGDTTQTGSHDP